MLISVVQARANMPSWRSTTPIRTTQETPSAAQSGTKRATWSSSGASTGYVNAPILPSQIPLTPNKDWNPIVQGVANAAPYIKTYPMCAVTPLDSFVFDSHVALLGDAAHAHGGGVAIGGSLAINDAYAFALALTHVWPPADNISTTSASPLAKPTQEQLEKVLKLYDETRRPLVNRLLAGVHALAQKRRWMAEKKTVDGKGETDEQLRARIANRPDLSWLTEHDVEAEFEKVVSLVEAV